VVTQILSESKNQQNQKEEFLSELSGLVQKYFGNKNINFSI
jgi:hypothetical protein